MTCSICVSAAARQLSRQFSVVFIDRDGNYDLQFLRQCSSTSTVPAVLQLSPLREMAIMTCSMCVSAARQLSRQFSVVFIERDGNYDLQYLRQCSTSTVPPVLRCPH